MATTHKTTGGSKVIRYAVLALAVIGGFALFVGGMRLFVADEAASQRQSIDAIERAAGGAN